MMQVQQEKYQKDLDEQKNYFEEINKGQAKRIMELEIECKDHQKEFNFENNKEIRRYVEGLNEKDIELNNLKRQIQSQKNRISSLEQEINNLSNVKENYEIYVIKSVDQIKSNLKEANNFIEDVCN